MLYITFSAKFGLISEKHLLKASAIACVSVTSLSSTDNSVTFVVLDLLLSNLLTTFHVALGLPHVSSKFFLYQIVYLLDVIKIYPYDQLNF